jgi:hypothetical protein
MANLIEHDDPLLNDLNYNDLEVSEQAQIDALIAVASEMIEKKCNRIFLADDYAEEKHNGLSENWIFVNNPPINDLESIVVVGAENTTYEGALFSYNAKTGEIRWDENYLLQNTVTDWIGLFPQGFNNILINYNGGFEEVPQGIKLLCAQMTKEGFDPGNSPGSLEFEKLGQYFYKTRKDFFQTFLLTNKNILNLYTLKRVGER